MFKKMMIAVLSLFICLSVSGIASAMEQGNKRKGKYTYRKVYKACHARGAVDTAKPPLNPDAHTQAEWTQIFDDKQFSAFGCDEEWAALTDAQVIDIYSYLHAHASDSPTPLKCK
jgi:hypothetical protein